MDPRKPPLSPACFRYKGEKLDWRMVQGNKWEEWLRTANFEQIHEVIRHLVSARLDEEEISRFRGPALQRLLELTQKSTQLLTFARHKAAPGAVENGSEDDELPTEVYPCSVCRKQFLSLDYLRKHTDRRHGAIPPTVPRPSSQPSPRPSEPRLLQEAASFLQTELDRVREVSEKQLEETISGMQFLLSKAEKITKRRRRETPKSDGGSTLNLIRELAKAQKEMLEYDTELIKAILLKERKQGEEIDRETASVESQFVTSAELVEDYEAPQKEEKRVESKEKDGKEKNEVFMSDVEIEVEVTESSETLREIVAAGKLIGFDIYERPEYRFLAEELVSCPVPPCWCKVDNGVAVMYRNAKTMETSLFHPKLESFQLRFRHFERVTSIGKELRSQLVDKIPKSRSFEDKYRGRLLHFFPHSEEELKATKAALSSQKPAVVSRKSVNFPSVREQLRTELDRLCSIRSHEIAQQPELTEESSPNVRQRQQEFASPPTLKLSKASISMKPLISSIVRLKEEQESGSFSLFFRKTDEGMKKLGTKIGEESEEQIWEFKNLRIAAEIHGLISTSEVYLPVAFSGLLTFSECDLLISLSTRSNGLSSSVFHQYWRGLPTAETFDIEFQCKSDSAPALLSSSRFTRL